MIDSYAWIEHFLGSDKGRRVDEVLEDAEEIYTPDTVLAEIARKYVREGIESKIVETRLREIAEASNIVCVDPKIALEAANCYLEMAVEAKKSNLGQPGLFDALLLAFAKSLKSKVITGDPHFKGHPETLWIG